MYCNFIFCESKLPIPEEILREFPETKWGEVEFLNYDLFGLFSQEKFEISEDNQFYLRREDGTIERQNITRSIIFWVLLASDDYDYFLFFESQIYKGEVKEITFYKLEKTENELRKKAEKVVDETIDKYNQNKHKTRYKIYSHYCSCVMLLFSLVRVVLGSLINLTWKIQNKIA